VFCFITIPSPLFFFVNPDFIFRFPQGGGFRPDRVAAGDASLGASVLAGRRGPGHAGAGGHCEGPRGQQDPPGPLPTGLRRCADLLGVPQVAQQPHRGAAVSKETRATTSQCHTTGWRSPKRTIITISEIIYTAPKNEKRKTKLENRQQPRPHAKKKPKYNRFCLFSRVRDDSDVLIHDGEVGLHHVAIGVQPELLRHQQSALRVGEVSRGVQHQGAVLDGHTAVLKGQEHPAVEPTKGLCRLTYV